MPVSALVTQWMREYLERGSHGQRPDLPPASERAYVGLYVPGDLVARVRRRLRNEKLSLSSLLAGRAAQEDPWFSQARRRRHLVGLLKKRGLGWVAESPEAVNFLIAQIPPEEAADRVLQLAEILRTSRPVGSPAGGALLGWLELWCASETASRTERPDFRRLICGKFPQELALADLLARAKPSISPSVALVLLRTLPSLPDGLSRTSIMNEVVAVAGGLVDTLRKLMRTVELGAAQRGPEERERTQPTRTPDRDRVLAEWLGEWVRQMANLLKELSMEAGAPPRS